MHLLQGVTVKIKGGDDYNSSRSVAWPARGKDPVVMYAAHGSVVIRANPLVKRQMRHRKHVLLVTNPQGVSNARCVLPATGSLLTPLRDGRLSSPKSAAEGVAEAPHGSRGSPNAFPFPCVSPVSFHKRVGWEVFESLQVGKKGARRMEGIRSQCPPPNLGFLQRNPRGRSPNARSLTG